MEGTDITPGRKEADVKPFEQEKYVGHFREVISENFREVEALYVYRTCQSLPCNQNDRTPVRLRNLDEQGNPISRVYSPEETQDWNDARKLKEVCHYALSCNDTPENAANAALAQYNKLRLSGKPQEILDTYADSRGRYIGRFLITPDVGMISDFKNGHANLLVYEGVDLESTRDSDFAVEIDYEDKDGTDGE